jgi:nucleoside-diphosphate-sugar epimerase
MKIFITAIGGFLGDKLARHFEARGHAVAGSTRRTMELGRPFDATVFEGQDALIHCAHDFAPGAHERNVTGTKAWLETAAALGVKRQIYLSSYSARANAASEYGRTKYEIERMFLDRGHTVLRPGLVAGPRGLFARQRAALLRTPIVPAVGAGLQPIASISLEDFLAATDVALRLAFQGRTGAFNLFYEPMPAYREFVRGIRWGKPTLFIPIPVPLAVALTAAAQFLRVPLPVKPDQIRALVENETMAGHSDLRDLLARGPGKTSDAISAPDASM